jgi:hypothetical protein
MRFVFILPALLLLAGCATPSTAYTVATPDAVAQEAAHQEEVINAGKWAQAGQRAPASFTSQFPTDQRVIAITERVLVAAAPFCSDRLMNAYAVSVGSRDAGPPVVLNAAPPLRPGDRIVAFNGRAVPGGPQGYIFLNREGGNQTRTGQPLTLTAQRGRQHIEASYDVIPACAFNLTLENNNQWNAYADGDSIHLEKKLVDDLNNDDDLAFVVAHELAHNLLGHVGKAQQNMMAGALLGLGVEAIIGALGGGSMNGEIAKAGAGAGQMTFSQEFEREADYVGLYILALAGYDLNAGPRVARRIAEQDPRAIRYASTHPSSSDRAASLFAAIEEIKQKQKSGAPLTPNAAKKKGEG